MVVNGAPGVAELELISYMKTATRIDSRLLEILLEYNGLTQVKGNGPLFICSSCSIGERWLSVIMYIHLSDQRVRLWNNNKPNDTHMSWLLSALLLHLSVQGFGGYQALVLAACSNVRICRRKVHVLPAIVWCGRHISYIRTNEILDRAGNLISTWN